MHHQDNQTLAVRSSGTLDVSPVAAQTPTQSTQTGTPIASDVEPQFKAPVERVLLMSLTRIQQIHEQLEFLSSAVLQLASVAEDSFLKLAKQQGTSSESTAVDPSKLQPTTPGTFGPRRS